MSKIAPLLLGMAIVVLLVACLNLANMLLARGTARRKEIAIRLALGGSRSRIVRQLLTEGLVLSLLGGACGLVLGLWSSDLLMTSLGKMLPLDIVWLGGPNAAILAATFGFCVLGTLGFALGPALKLSRSAVVGDLKEQAGEDVVRRRWKFLPRNPLVVVQIAFSLALLTAAALFIRGAGKAASVNTGLQPGASFMIETDASLAGYEPKRAQDLYRSLNERLAALPGVERTSVSATVPFGMISLEQECAASRPPARPRREAGDGRGRSGLQRGLEQRWRATISPRSGCRSYAGAHSTKRRRPSPAARPWRSLTKCWRKNFGLRAMRLASGSNSRATTPLARRAATLAWECRKTSAVKSTPARRIEIVGIVPATRNGLFESDPSGAIYVPFGRGFQSNISFFVRFRTLAPGSETGTADLLRRTVREVDSALPILSLKSFAQHLESNFQLWIVRAGAAMFSVFGALALGLAVVGLYGVKAYSVARRTREIGIRMALGAQRGEVLRMFLREGSVMLLCGLVLGLLLAAGTGKILSGLLYEVGALGSGRIHRCARPPCRRRARRDLAPGASRHPYQPNGGPAHGIAFTDIRLPQARSRGARRTARLTLPMETNSLGYGQSCRASNINHEESGCVRCPAAGESE